jgi:hypothetical protein
MLDRRLLIARGGAVPAAGAGCWSCEAAWLAAMITSSAKPLQTHGQGSHNADNKQSTSGFFCQSERTLHSSVPTTKSHQNGPRQLMCVFVDTFNLIHQTFVAGHPTNTLQHTAGAPHSPQHACMQPTQGMALPAPT